MNVKFSVDEPGPSSRPASPSLRGNRLLGLGTPRPGTPVIGGSSLRSQTVASLEPKHPIQTPQQFYDWFALIDRSVTHSQEAHFRAHLANLAHHLETCDRFAQLVDEVEGEVEKMLSEWRSVEDSGKSLKDACEHMLEERVRALNNRVVLLLTTPFYHVGQTVADDRLHLRKTRVLPGAGACYSYAQPSRRITRPSNRLLIHGGKS